jgi:D-3-phosphoglycerate dehydrogenase
VLEMLILISDAFDKGLPAQLAKFGEVTDDKTRLPEANVVLIRSKTKCTKEYIDGAPKLKMIIRGGVGLDNVDLDYAKEKGVEVHNTPEASSIAVAEMAFALLLAVPNHIVEAHTSMAAGRWEKKQLKRTELYGKTLGLIGCGRIASEVAKRAQAFGMKIIGFDAFLKEHPVVDLKGSMEEMLAEADYVSIHTPVTPTTQGMINAKALETMKDGAVLINTGRGKCIVEADVAAALESGKLGFYATDVWESDPPNFETCPLIKAPHVLMAPHLGASTKENLLRIGDIVVEKLTAFQAKSN